MVERESHWKARYVREVTKRLSLKIKSGRFGKAFFLFLNFMGFSLWWVVYFDGDGDGDEDEASFKGSQDFGI